MGQVGRYAMMIARLKMEKVNELRSTPRKESAGETKK